MAGEDGHAIIWRRLDEHGERLHEVGARLSDLARQHASYDADVRALRAQLSEMRDRQLLLETQSADRHAEIMRRLDSLSAHRSGAEAVAQYRRDVAKWVAIVVAILVGMGLLSARDAVADAVAIAPKTQAERGVNHGFMGKRDSVF